jgi:alanine racemase
MTDLTSAFQVVEVLDGHNARVRTAQKELEMMLGADNGLRRNGLQRQCPRSRSTVPGLGHLLLTVGAPGT